MDWILACSMGRKHGATVRYAEVGAPHVSDSKESLATFLTFISNVSSMGLCCAMNLTKHEEACKDSFGIINESANTGDAGK